MLTENDLHAGVTYHSKTQEGLEQESSPPFCQEEIR